MAEFKLCHVTHFPAGKNSLVKSDYDITVISC